MEPVLKTALDTKVGRPESFEECWAPVADPFLTLKEFCGGIATVFTNLTLVEADFSLLGLKKNEYRKALRDLSLEGVIHSRQFLNLAAL